MSKACISGASPPQPDPQPVCWPARGALAFKSQLRKFCLGTQPDRGCPPVPPSCSFSLLLWLTLCQAVQSGVNRSPCASRPLGWPLPQTHICNSKWGEVVGSPEAHPAAGGSRTPLLLCPGGGHSPKHLGRLLLLHFWRGRGSTPPREKERQDGRNPGPEAQRGGPVGMPPKSPRLCIYCSLPAPQILAPCLLPPTLCLSHPAAQLCPSAFPSLNWPR